MTTATTATMRQINDKIGLLEKKNRAARAPLLAKAPYNGNNDGDGHEDAAPKETFAPFKVNVNLKCALVV